jgi:hypothetical protein
MEEQLCHIATCDEQIGNCVLPVYSDSATLGCETEDTQILPNELDLQNVAPRRNGYFEVFTSWITGCTSATTSGCVQTGTNDAVLLKSPNNILVV